MKAISMIAPPSGQFRQEARENFDRGTIDMILDLDQNNGSKAIHCRVSREALEDRSGTSGEIALIELFARYRPEVETAIERRLKAGMFELDGSILVRSGELLRV